MSDLNDCKFRGRLVRDPVARINKDGKVRVYFTLAVNRNISKKNNPEGEKVDFIPFVAFSGVANFIEKYAKKGRLVAVDDSSFRVGSWQDGDGTWHTMFNFIVNEFSFLDKKPADPDPAVVKTVGATEEFEKASPDIYSGSQGFVPIDPTEDVPF